MSNVEPPGVVTIFSCAPDLDAQTFELLRAAIGKMATDIPQIAVRAHELHTLTIKGDGTRQRANALHRDVEQVLAGHTIAVVVNIETTRTFRLAVRGAELLARGLAWITGVPVSITFLPTAE